MMDAAVSFGAIILAAGFSSRMGEPKPLLPLGESVFLERVLNHPFLRGPRVFPVVVLGHEAEAIRAAVDPAFPVVVNDDVERGRTGSVQCGLGALPEVSGAFIWPVDCPSVSEKVLTGLADAFVDERSICIPSHKHRRGHPPLIGAAYFAEIMKMAPDQPLRDLYQGAGGHIIHVETDDESVLWNINTPEDYRLLIERWRRKEMES
ncbi:MAG: NTP transferase domain-containing protein [bacterium]|nr:NTP transferase domain-containing protein [bacterium]